MIGSVIPKDNSILLPTRFFKVKGFDKVLEKGSNHVTVGGSVT